MVIISDEYDSSTRGEYFSSPNKNLGNKLFIYGCARLISDILNVNLICPENSIVRRENQKTLEYENQFFPFGSIMNRKEINQPIFLIDDQQVFKYKTIQNIIDSNKNTGFKVQSYFSKYDYIKPYKKQIREMYKKLTLPSRDTNDIIILLRNSNMASDFILPDNYYLDILEKENFENLYVSLDHTNKHEKLLKKLEKYNPIILDLKILELFSEITSFKKIIASQGTFSFWACFLSNAEIIYWPMTNDGPNSNNEKWAGGVNLKVDDEEKYKFIYVNNIFENEK
jgi:hypothetical protein